MRMVSAGRDLEYKRLRKERLTEGFNHWRKLSFMEYPKLNNAKLTAGLKGLAKEIRLHWEYQQAMLAAKRDLFADRYRADGEAEEDSQIESKYREGDFTLMNEHDYQEVNKFLRYCIAQDGIE